jgi:hypothetical protein
MAREARGPHDDDEDDGDGEGADAGGEWQVVWDARTEALEKIFGPSDENIFTSMIPIYVGGKCDVMVFKQHVKGVTYVTAGLTETSEQPPSELGQYEMVMCSRKPNDDIAGLLSELSNYTLGSTLSPHDTIDMGEDQPKGVTMRALLALEYQPGKGKFELMGKQCGLLLLVGITAAELTAFRRNRADEVLEKLAKSVLPFTDLKRRSVV